MNCRHEDYELTAEDLEIFPNDIIGDYNIIHQHFVCLDCGAIGERTYRIPVQITWNESHQTKLDIE
jgi:Fe2+ or Zn2+ uptake regulation protein